MHRFQTAISIYSGTYPCSSTYKFVIQAIFRVEGEIIIEIDKLLSSSRTISRLYQLDEKRTHFIQLNPEVIDHGFFRNDVIVADNRSVLFCHEKALKNSQQAYRDIRHAQWLNKNRT